MDDPTPGTPDPLIRILRLMAETDDAAPVLLSAADRLEDLTAEVERLQAQLQRAQELAREADGTIDADALVHPTLQLVDFLLAISPTPTEGPQP